MTARRALVNADGQGTHTGNTLGHLHAQQHTAATGLGALPQNDFDGIGLAQVIRVHAITRRQVLVNQVLGLAAFFRRHATVARGGTGACNSGAAPQGFFRIGRQCTEAHAGDCHRNFQVDRLLGEPVTEDYIRSAFLTVAFQRVARDACTEQQQVVEVRQLALGTTAANVIDAGLGGTLDFLDSQTIKGGRLAQDWRGFSLIFLLLNQYAEALSTLKLYSWRAEP